MGFLHLSAWRSVGGRRAAERRGTAVPAPPPRYYYDNIREFQTIVDGYFEAYGHRPAGLAELYLWHLTQEGSLENERRAVDLADLLSYYDIEKNSLLAMVSLDRDHAARAGALLEARRIQVTRRPRVRAPAVGMALA